MTRPKKRDELCKTCGMSLVEHNALPAGHKFVGAGKFELSKKELEKWRNDMTESFIKKEAERRRKENEPPKDPRTGTCVVCKGKVVGRVSREFVGEWRTGRMPTRIVHHGFHCTQCGLKYEFPPNDHSENPPPG